MEPSHCREIHYHLARAIMRLNSIAGFLPLIEPAVDWDDHDADPYRRTILSHPHSVAIFIHLSPFLRPRPFLH